MTPEEKLAAYNKADEEQVAALKAMLAAYINAESAAS